jgi:hypothetical protein
MSELLRVAIDMQHLAMRLGVDLDFLGWARRGAPETNDKILPASGYRIPPGLH